LGCQWKERPIEKDGEGRPQIGYTRVYSAWRRWVGNGCMAAILVASVLKLHQNGLLDTRVIHDDGTTTAKKGGYNIGFSGHKKLKGDKVVAFCDRRCNVIAPFVSAPGNGNESPAARGAAARPLSQCFLLCLTACFCHHSAMACCRSAFGRETAVANDPRVSPLLSALSPLLSLPVALSPLLSLPVALNPVLTQESLLNRSAVPMRRRFHQSIAVLPSDVPASYHEPCFPARSMA
jgi:hypothetical protein